MEPPTIIKQYQEEAETCSKEKFIKIIKVHKDYFKFLKGQERSEERDTWFIQAEMWLEMLEEISLTRFKEKLVNPEFTVRFSYGTDITEGFKRKEIKWEDVYKLANSKFNYSPSVFANGYRKKENWIDGNDCIVLDIDDGWTIEEAMSFLIDYDFKALITTTKSHQKEKEKKPACDRFRIFLPTNEPFRGDFNEFSYMMGEIFKFFQNKPDTAARDVSRFYYGNEKGRHFYIDGENKLDLNQFPRKTPKREYKSNYKKEIGNKDKYEAITNWFIREASEGNRNNTLFKAYNFFKNEGYTDLYSIIDHINSKLSNPLPEHEIKQICRLK